MRGEPHLKFRQPSDAFIQCFPKYNISATAAYSGASQQWVCAHRVNLSMGLKGSFGKCNLESIGLACGRICSTGFMQLLALCVHLLQMGFCFNSGYWEIFGQSRRAISPAIFQANIFKRPRLLFAVILDQLSIFLPAERVVSLALCIIAFEAAVSQGSRDLLLYF